MALIGLGTAFVGACIADVAGSAKTRRFTRSAFLATAFWATGGRASGLASWGGDVMEMIPL